MCEIILVNENLFIICNPFIFSGSSVHFDMEGKERAIK